MVPCHDIYENGSMFYIICRYRIGRRRTVLGGAASTGAPIPSLSISLSSTVDELLLSFIKSKGYICAEISIHHFGRSSSKISGVNVHFIAFQRDLVRKHVLLFLMHAGIIDKFWFIDCFNTELCVNNESGLLCLCNYSF